MRKGFLNIFWSLLLGCGLSALSNPNVLAITNVISHSKHDVPFTQIRLLTPFTAVGLNPKVSVNEIVDGTCWASSLSDSSRPNTWRCSSGSSTYDPCFVNPTREQNSVICLKSPWEPNAVQLTLSTPLPTNKLDNLDFHSQSAQPWALELANGSQCTLITGPSLTVAGMKTSYQCDAGAIAIGNIDRSHKKWTVLFQKNDDLFMAQTDILTAWY